MLTQVFKLSSTLGNVFFLYFHTNRCSSKTNQSFYCKLLIFAQLGAQELLLKGILIHVNQNKQASLPDLPCQV